MNTETPQEEPLFRIEYDKGSLVSYGILVLVIIVIMLADYMSEDIAIGFVFVPLILISTIIMALRSRLFWTLFGKKNYAVECFSNHIKLDEYTYQFEDIKEIVIKKDPFAGSVLIIKVEDYEAEFEMSKWDVGPSYLADLLRENLQHTDFPIQG